MSLEENREKIRAFMNKFFKRPDLKDDDNIFAMGFVNSLFAMQLVMFLEKEFAIKVGNKDLDLKNFNSVNAITDLIVRKRAEV